MPDGPRPDLRFPLDSLGGELCHSPGTGETMTPVDGLTDPDGNQVHTTVEVHDPTATWPDALAIAPDDFDVDAAANAIGWSLAGEVDDLPGLRRRAARHVLSHVAVRRQERIDAGTTTIPAALEGSDGDTWFVRGHVAPEAMLLAVTIAIATFAGNGEAGEFLTGLDLEHLLPGDEPIDKLAHANELLPQVSHRWWVDTGDEWSPFVEPGTPDAEPLTVLSL